MNNTMDPPFFQQNAKFFQPNAIQTHAERGCYTTFEVDHVVK